MADAEVGDDVYGEDPTVNRLQSLAAASARQGGRALRAVGDDGEPARDPRARRDRAPRCCAPTARTSTATRPRPRRVNSGVQMHPLWDLPDGMRAAIEGVAHHLPTPSLLVIENTYMALSGAPIAAGGDGDARARSRTPAVCRVHVDGARIWNAADRARASPPRELVAPADTVMFCLSKGLGAPVGSVLCGPADVIARGARASVALGRRHAPGGRDRGRGHRRAGDDGRTARRRPRAGPPCSPTRSRSRWPGSVDPAQVRTNIVCADLRAPPGRLRRAARRARRAGGHDRSAHVPPRHPQGRRRRRRSRRRSPPSTSSGPADRAARRDSRARARDLRASRRPRDLGGRHARPLGRRGRRGARRRHDPRRQGHERPRRRSRRARAAAGRGDGGRGAGARHRRAPPSRPSRRRDRRRPRAAARAGAPDPHGAARRRCAVPIRPRCSSATRTSTIATIASPVGRRSTRSRPRPGTRTTSPS